MKILIILSAIIVFTSCKTQQLYLNVVEPAPVTLPSYIAKAGIIDRSQPTGEAKKTDAIDRVLTLEGAELDIEGANASISGLTDELLKNDRFSVIKRIGSGVEQNTGLGVFPPPMEWDKVTAVCLENGVDALFSLELFDTDTKVSYQVRKTDSRKTLLGAIAGIEQQADMLTIVKTGWRIYDPSSKSILDEIVISRDLTFHSTGLTPAIAAAALTDRKEAVKQVGNNAGQAFAWRLLPYQIRVHRDYFVKGTDNFEIAMRKARTGNWDQAGELWLEETSNPQMKIAGRACYNMAIISEINGDVDMALDWARRAYEDYNNREALRYLNILEYRKTSNEIIKEQEGRE
jgi:hypothetical protein